MEIGKESLCFLDLKMSIVNGRLETTVYSKPTDSHLYLHQQSCHKPSVIKGIRKGVALRLRRICSSDDEYLSKSKEYAQFLVDRGHSSNEVKKVFEDIGKIPRLEARKKVDNNAFNKIIFSTSYNPRGPDVHAIVKKHLPLLSNHPGLSTLYPPNSVLVANKRERNLKDLLMRADPYNLKVDLLDGGNKGFSKCDARRCDACANFLIETDVVTCNATGRKYGIRQSLTCETPNVVYVAFCSHCKKQGVGSTTAWKPRLRNYKSHINKGVKSCKIVTQFMEGCSNPSLLNLKFILVNCLKNTDGLTTEEIDSLLLKKEQFWDWDSHYTTQGHEWYP